MEILRAENCWMDRMTADCQWPGSDLPLAARRRLLRRWLFEHRVEHISFDAVEKILELMADGTGTSIFELNDTQRVVIEYGIPRLEDRRFPAVHPGWTLTAEPHIGWVKDRSAIGCFPASASFCAQKIGHAAIEIRSVQNGDRMRPMGLEGSRKLQDIFTDLKIPRSERNHLPVVLCRGEIIWVPGYRISRDWAVPDQSSPSVLVQIEQKSTV
jgi:tRNA(Ile)-lysidine synthase